MGSTAQIGSDPAPVTWQDYARAERLLPWNAAQLMFTLDVDPCWISDSDTFWYRADRSTGRYFLKVDPSNGSSVEAFDRVRLASALSRASGKPIDHQKLPFDEISFSDDLRQLWFSFGSVDWTCDLETYECVSVERPEAPESDVVRSPDGQWDAYTRDSNLWIRSVTSGKERQLTTDGEAGYAWGSPLVSPLVPAGIAPAQPPAVSWSPTSASFLSCRIDARDVPQLHLVQSVPRDGGIRPRLHSYAYPLPGDEKTPQAELWTFDIADAAAVRIEQPAISMLYYGSPLSPSSVLWTEDGERVFLVSRDRGYLTYRLHEHNLSTGKAREVIVETGQTGIDPYLLWAATNVRILGDGSQAIWYSMRDGWGHLYLYDTASGDLIRQLTSGAFNVSEIIQIDESTRTVYFLGVGREAGMDPYYNRLYRVSLDGGEIELLTPEDAEHGAIFSPSSRYVVNTYSRQDLPPVSVLRKADGTVVAELERADVEPLKATGWTFAERFNARARDGVTDVYGIILRPSTMDPARSYPVIDYIYGGPQTNQAPSSFMDSKRIGGAIRGNPGGGFWQAQAIAELGFIVVMIDGLGMPARSKAYHDHSYRNLGDGGLEDHIFAIRQLADRYPYLDLERVGIFGHSAGGYQSAHAILAFPDFFKVCVSSAGNHDHRLDKASWVERYMGLPVEDHYRQQANQTLAANLKGKLLLIHGEMDENVHPGSTLVVVDALINENKDFDLLVIPNLPHQSDNHPYFVRRRWDYFVTHLLGADPPAGYRIRDPDTTNRAPGGRPAPDSGRWVAVRSGSERSGDVARGPGRDSGQLGDYDLRKV